MLLQPRPRIPGQQYRPHPRSLLSRAGLIADWFAGFGAAKPEEINNDGPGGEITAWNGFDGTTNHLIGHSTGKQPVYSVSTPALNGRGGAYFGGDDLVYGAYGPLVGNLTVFNIFVVFSTTAGIGAAPMNLYAEGRTSSVTPFVSVKVNSDVDGDLETTVRDNSGVSANTSDLADHGTNDGLPHLLTLRRVAVDVFRLRLDGVEIASTLEIAPGSMTINRITLGCHWRTSIINYYTGWIGRCRLHGQEVYAEVEPVLADLYGI